MIKGSSRFRNIFPGMLLLGFLLQASAPAAPGYATNKQLAQQIKNLSGKNKNLVRAESLARSLKNNDVWLLELGAGSAEELKQRPAMLLVAGIEGNDLAGTAMAMAWAESLANNYQQDKAIRALLDSATIYIFPRVNPDGGAFFFAKPKMELSTNLRPVDDDHDGLVDEDGPDDLDKDGLITSMRVQDPEGEYILDPNEPRLLVKADRLKGEKGAWRVFSEGIDNDHDDAWNEDGPGGVNLNRNFPYNYKYFAPWAGLHQVSEPETRALADFAVAHPNIGIVFTFGAADNLLQTPKAEAPKRPPVAIHEEDIGYYRELGKAWRTDLGLSKELTGSSAPGTFSDWMYFHRGRLSLAARPWSPAIQLGLAKPEKEANPPKEENPEAKAEEQKQSQETKGPAPRSGRRRGPPEKAKSDEGSNEEERPFIKWLDANAPEEFVAWKEYSHPDFPGKHVDVGGFVPFAKTVPPQKLLADLAREESEFLTTLAGKLPRIGIRKIETKHLGNGIYDVTLEIENTGYLPTALAQGNLTQEVYPTRVLLKLDSKAILSGQRITMLGPIEGSGGKKEVRYVLNGNDQPEVQVDIISMLGGTISTNIVLKEGK